ncbi:MAG: chemotaxis protein CheW [Acidobacteriota bacterium]
MSDPETADSSILERYLLFDIAGQRYALSTDAIVEVIWMVALTPTPAHHQHVEGVINYRGHILPILNIRRYLSLPSSDYGLNHRILVVRTGHHLIGLVVDAVPEVEEFSADQKESPREFDEDLAFVTGLMKHKDRIVFCLDLPRLLTQSGVPDLREITATPGLPAPVTGQPSSQRT